MKTKICSKCSKIKKLSSFYDDKKLRIGKSSQCKNCIQATHAKWLKKNKQKWVQYSKERKLKIRYNISINEYNKLLKKQNSVCAICSKPELSKTSKGKTRLLSVDHNHKTGKVRGLLCGTCNIGFGSFKENITFLKAAIKYARNT